MPAAGQQYERLISAKTGATILSAIGIWGYRNALFDLWRRKDISVYHALIGSLGLQRIARVTSPVTLNGKIN